MSQGEGYSFWCLLGGCLLIPIVTRNKGQNVTSYSSSSSSHSVSDVTDSGLASEAEKKQLVIDSIHITDDLPSHPPPHHPVQSGPALGRPSLCQVFVLKVEKLPRRNLIHKYIHKHPPTHKGGSSKVFILFAAVWAQ